MLQSVPEKIVPEKAQGEFGKGYNPTNFMPDARALDAHYKTLTDHELLKLRADGGFTLEAEQLLDQELARRNFTSDEADQDSAPEWLDKADVGTVGVLVLEERRAD